jgi:hypothetical protein
MSDHTQGLWLWVAHPEHTQESDGSDRLELEPEYKSRRDVWWTCSEETRSGDLVLLYRTAPYSEVHWLLKTHGTRYSIDRDPTARREGWRWGTAYEVLASFDNTVTFAEMSNSQPLARWDAIDRNLQGGHVPDEPGVWPVPTVYWRAMVTRLIRRNPQTKAVFANRLDPTPDWLQEGAT